LDRVTHDWAGRRMDRAIASALGGRQVVSVADEVSRAKGVDAHVEEHAAARSSGGQPDGLFDFGPEPVDGAAESVLEPGSPRKP
jgi:hypothetical protein